MSKIWYTSDLHFGHKNIVQYTNRAMDTTQEDHDEWLIDLWNSQVNKGELVYHLGDFSFSRNVMEIQRLLKRLNGVKHFIKGNHDDRQVLDVLKKNTSISWWGDYKETKIGGNSTILFHFPIANWHKQHHGSFHLHGHCFDDLTEVLTNTGFKNKDDIAIGDVVATVSSAGFTEYQQVVNKFDYKTKVKMYNYSGKSVSFDITEGHRFFYRPYEKQQKQYTPVKDVRGNVAIPVCSENSNKDFSLSDNLLKLYLHICTDGSFENSSLVRFHLKKERKIVALCDLLTELGISYSFNKTKEKTVKINFTLPFELRKFNIKPLDSELILNLSSRQVDILVSVYEKTDGCKTGLNSWQFSTSKKSEAELLQHILVTSGYRCNLLKRVRGKYTLYILSLNSSKESITNSSKFKQYLAEKSVWCLTVPNGNLIVRREGKVHITGNCHGSYVLDDGKILDVGLDSAYNIFGEHKFFSEEDVLEYMQGRNVVVNDHHTKRTGEM